MNIHVTVFVSFLFHRKKKKIPNTSTDSVSIGAPPRMHCCKARLSTHFSVQGTCGSSSSLFTPIIHRSVTFLYHILETALNGEPGPAVCIVCLLCEGRMTIKGFQSQMVWLWLPWDARVKLSA